MDAILNKDESKQKANTVKSKKILSSMVRDRYLYLLLVPFVAFYVIFEYFPMYGLQIAFKNYNIAQGISGSPWVGLEFFRKFFTGPYFYRVLRNTLAINLLSLVVGFPIPIILALLLNDVRNQLFKRVSQTLVYIPHFISTVVVVGLVTNFLSPSNGLINIIIEHLGGEKVYFLTKPEYFRSIFISMNIWKEAGFSSIIYLASLAAVDVQLYEASTIDGANKWKQLIHVTIPGIAPTIIIMLIMKVGHLLDLGYEAIILLYQPVTYETADVISTYVYRSGLMEGQYSLATAVGVFNGIVAFILVYAANKISKKVSETSMW